MPIATVNLLKGYQVTAGAAPGIYCPFGYTIIIKHVSVRNLHTAAQMLIVDLYPKQVAQPHALLSQSVAAATTVQLDIWAVMESEDQMFVSGDAGPFTYWISGSLLSGEAPPVLPVIAFSDRAPQPAPQPVAGLPAAAPSIKGKRSRA